MGTHEEMRKQVKRKFRPEARDHELCLKKLEDAEQTIKEMETRLHATFREREEMVANHDVKEQVSSSTINDLRSEVKKLEDEVKHERRRATQALDVAESTSDAAGGIGRLLRQIVDDGVMDQLRISQQEREQKYRESMRHRRPG